MHPRAPVPHVCRPKAARSVLGIAAERVLAPIAAFLGLVGALAVAVSSKAFASAYPGDLDEFSNPSGATPMNAPGSLHSTQHANANDAIEAIEAKLGTGPSVPTTPGDVLTVTEGGRSAWSHSGTTELAVFPVGRYGSVQAAMDAAHAAGGGRVVLAVGPNPVSAGLVAYNNVRLEGPAMEWSVWGYNAADPAAFYLSYLTADGTAGAVYTVPVGVVNSAIENVMIKANGRDGVVVADDAATRGGNRVKNVYVNGGARGFYFGQKECRTEKLLAMACSGDGITFAAQDGDCLEAVTGFNGGHGFVLGPNSGPTRVTIVDSFNNALDGILIDGFAHTIGMIQSNNNKRRGVNFRNTTGSQIAQALVQNNGQEYDGVANLTRYPDVAFSHPTASNEGCGILGGAIYTTDGKASRAVLSTEAIAGFPKLQGVYTTTAAYASGNSAAQRVFPLQNFNIQGCENLPDNLIPQAGVAVLLRPNGTVDLLQATDGSLNALSGLRQYGAFYGATDLQTLGANGAVTIDARKCNHAVVTLAANATSMSITNAKAGQVVTIEIVQDATGGRTYVWPADCQFTGDREPPHLSAANARDTVTFVYDGVLAKWVEIARNGPKNDAGLGLIETVDALIGATTAAWPSANRGLFLRVRSAGPGMISKVGYECGTSSGNLSVAVYRNSGIGRAAVPTGAPVATSGAVASPGTGYQEISLGGTVPIFVGDWLFLSCDNTTFTIVRHGMLTGSDLELGRARRMDAAHPAPTVGALAATSFIPVLVGVP